MTAGSVEHLLGQSFTEQRTTPGLTARAEVSRLETEREQVLEALLLGARVPLEVLWCSEAHVLSAGSGKTHGHRP